MKLPKKAATLILAIVTALTGVVLTGCNSKPFENQGPSILLPYREWKEGPFTTVRVVKPVGHTRQKAEVWLEALPHEVSFFRFADTAVLINTTIGQRRKLQNEVHYPGRGIGIPISGYHLMKNGKEIDFHAIGPSLY